MYQPVPSDFLFETLLPRRGFDWLRGWLKRGMRQRKKNVKTRKDVTKFSRCSLRSTAMVVVWQRSTRSRNTRVEAGNYRSGCTATAATTAVEPHLGELVHQQLLSSSTLCNASNLSLQIFFIPKTIQTWVNIFLARYPFAIFPKNHSNGESRK